MNAGFNTVIDELDPLSIPRPGRPHGRSVLIPGFPAGIAAAHQKFGAIPFARLFDAAIAIAEEGFPISSDFAGILHDRRRLLSKLGPNTFVRDRGRLRQPELASTLRKLADHGPSYIYRGPWGEQFIHAVRRRGGRMSAQDLRRYQPGWVEPVRTSFRDCEVYATGLPSTGGIYLIEAFNLIEALNFGPSHYAEDPNSLFWLMQATHARYLHYWSAADQRVQKEEALHLARQLRVRAGFTYLDALKIQENAHHSDAVVCADKMGNVAALCHSINTNLWGELGLFVDGISIPDSGSFQQIEIARAGPGARLPDAMNPTLALRDGKPVFASGCTGAGLHEVTLQMALNTLQFDMDLQCACRTPLFVQPAWTGLFRLTASDRKPWAQMGNRLFEALMKVALQLYPLTRQLANLEQIVPKGQFAPEVLAAVQRKGQRCQPFGKGHAPSFWAGVQLDKTKVAGASRSAIRYDTNSR